MNGRTRVIALIDIALLIAAIVTAAVVFSRDDEHQRAPVVVVRPITQTATVPSPERAG